MSEHADLGSTPAPDAPTVADGIFKPLDPRSVTVDRLSAAITVGVLGLGSLVGLLITLAALRPGPALALLLLVCWCGGLAALALLGVVWPAVRYRHAAYCVDGTGLRIRGGVLWRSEVAVPRSRVQHTDVSQGPIERGFGLATLVVHTAGTEHAAIPLGGLSRETAQAIRDHLIEIEGGEGDAV